jgi:hypothetical protein
MQVCSRNLMQPPIPSLPIPPTLQEASSALSEEVKKVHLTHKKLREETAGTSDYMCRKLLQGYREILDMSATEQE